MTHTARDPYPDTRKIIAKNRRTSRFFAALVAVSVITLLQPLPGGAYGKGKEKVLYSVPPANGDLPVGTMAIDKEGNLYGVAASLVDNGVVFKLTRSNGQWTQSVVYNFKGGTDGSYPAGGLIFDKAGNLYGVTRGGGSEDGCVGGCGTVFELTCADDGTWAATVLYSFKGGRDGASPAAALVFDAAGNLYGTTTSGGAAACQGGTCGTVFQLTPHAGEPWRESVLHRFVGGSDGIVAFGGVVVDESGYVYGTASLGGKYGNGIVFALTPNQGGNWKETILHSFRGVPDGAFPAAGLALFRGALYGTTYSGGETCQGNTACGTVFKMKRDASGWWTETVIHRFDGNDGIESFATPVLDAAGNLYGTTFEGGGSPCGVCGTAFRLTPSADGQWNETVLHNFGAYAGDAGTPEAGVLNRAGHLFGTSALGGASGHGTIYEITP